MYSTIQAPFISGTLHRQQLDEIHVIATRQSTFDDSGIISLVLIHKASLLCLSKSYYKTQSQLLEPILKSFAMCAIFCQKLSLFLLSREYLNENVAYTAIKTSAAVAGLFDLTFSLFVSLQFWALFYPLFFPSWTILTNFTDAVHFARLH